MLAVLIRRPRGQPGAARFDLSWWAVWLLVSGAMAVFWDLALRREEESEAPIAIRQDPIFGPLESFEDGVWLARERVQWEGSWVPVAVEAGGEGPSKEQQDLYREFLKDPSSYRQALVTAVRDSQDPGNHPGVIPLRLWLLPTEPDHPSRMMVEVRVDGDASGPHEAKICFEGGRPVPPPHVDGPRERVA
ncbi:MAG: hypothetical protein R3F17_16385 [Planctomycetota bacterium]